MYKRLGVNIEFFSQCGGDCAFCGWGQSLPTTRVPQLRSQEPPLDWERLNADLRYAQDEGAEVALMSNSVRWGQGRFHSQLLELLERCRKYYPGIRIWLNLGIIHDPKVFEDFVPFVFGYTNNIETSREHFPRICTTHRFEEKLKTLRMAKAAGLKISSGLCLGIGQEESDLQSAIGTLKNLQVDYVVLNFFFRINGLRIVSEVAPLSPERILTLSESFKSGFPNTPTILGGGRALLGDLENEALRIVDGIYIRRFLNHKRKK